MSILTIKKAKREGARLVIGIAGISGSGKTYTALELAYGLADCDASKVGLLDTENGRGRLYSDILVNSDGEVQEFMHADLDAPHSPQRYVDAILEFQAAGVKVLVIDSVSHEWAGLGGVLDIVAGQRASITGWKIAKPEHRKFVNVMLQSDMHIIACVRSTSKTDWKDPKNPVSLGIMPIQQEEFMFEMTVSMMMLNGGKQRDVYKSSGVEHIFGTVGMHSGLLTREHGKQLRAWVDGAAMQIDPEVEAARNHLRSISQQGMEAYRAAWPTLTKKIQKALTADGSHERLKAAAEAFDKQRAATEPGGEELKDLNRELAETGE